MPSLPPSGLFLNLFNPKYTQKDWGESQSKIHNESAELDTDADTVTDIDASTTTESISLKPPLSWNTFRDFTGLAHPFLSPTQTPHLPETWAEKSKNEAVWAFCQTFWSKPNEEEQCNFIRKREDQYAVGRNLFLQWFASKDWFQLTKTATMVMTDAGCDAYSFARALGSVNVGDLNDSPAFKNQDEIARRIFGPNAFVGQFMKGPICRFIRGIATISWRSQRRSLGRIISTIDSKKKKVQEQWEELLEKASDDEPMNAADIKTWMVPVRSLLNSLRRVGDTESMQELQSQRSKMQDILSTLQNDTASKSCKDIPKTLRDSLLLLANDEQVEEVTLLLQEELVELDPEIDEDVPTLHDDYSAGNKFDWTEGVEEYQTWTTQQLWDGLGLGNARDRSDERHIPLFHKVQDPLGLHNPWTDTEWFKVPANVTPFQLRWHQLVGINKLADNFFNSLPVLSMDGVGLGKTAQVVGFLAVVASFREHYEKFQDFPGKFANTFFQGTPGNIPDLPNLFVVPVNLVNQTIEELQRFLIYGSFDILPYLGKWERREVWWTEHWAKCRNSLGRRIIITTPSAIQSDFLAVMTAPENSGGRPKKSSTFEEIGRYTLYGQSWLTVVYDEIHYYRNPKNTFWAALSLRELSKFAIGMSATPVISSPLDIYNEGRVLGVASFVSAASGKKYNEMEKQLRSSASKDRRWMDQHGNRSSLLTAATNGEAIDHPFYYRKTMLESIKQIRKGFQGIVINRGLQSVDNAGNRISGLEPFLEHVLGIDIYEHEMKYLENLATELVRDGSHKFNKKASFYHPFRKSTTHLKLNADSGWKKLESLEEWKKEPSKKGDIVVEATIYILSKDGLPPLEIKDNELSPTTSRAIQSSVVGNKSPDKIVIFSQFMAALDMVENLLSLHGVKSLILKGTLPIEQRRKIVKTFRSSGRDGERVLLLSPVGIAGMNLPCANNLIIMDALWSAQDVQQLIGRLWRYPQEKPVHVYHIQANNTPENWLAYMSNSKSEMPEAFTNVKTKSSMRDLFYGRDDENEEGLEDSTGDRLQDNEASMDRSGKMSKGKARKRGRGKAAREESEEAGGPRGDGDQIEGNSSSDSRNTLSIPEPARDSDPKPNTRDQDKQKIPKKLKKRDAGIEHQDEKSSKKRRTGEQEDSSSDKPSKKGTKRKAANGMEPEEGKRLPKRVKTASNTKLSSPEEDSPRPETLLTEKMGNEAENTESEAQIQDLKGNGGNQKGKSTLGMKQVTDSALDKIEEMIKKFHTTLPSMSNKGSQGTSDIGDSGSSRPLAPSTKQNLKTKGGADSSISRLKKPRASRSQSRK